MLIKFLHLTAFVLALSPRTICAGDQGGTLSSLLHEALAHNPKIKASMQDAEALGFKQHNTLTAFLPSLDLIAEHGLQKRLSSFSTADANSPWQSQLSLKLSESLYDNGVSWVNRQTANVGVSLAQLSLEQARDEVALELIEAYLDSSQAEHLLLANLELQKTLNSQFNLAERQYRQGMRTRKDFLRFRGEVQRTDMQNLELVKQKQLALEKIAILIGKDKNTGPLAINFYDPRRVPLPTPPKKTLVAGTSREAQIFALQNQISDFDVELVRKKNLPQIKLNSYLSYLASDYSGTAKALYEQDQVQWGMSLSLEYNIWDFGSRQRDIAIAVAKKTASEYRFEEKMQGLDQTLNELNSDLDLGKKNHALAEELLKLEEESYALLASEFRQGRVNYLELVQGLQNLNAARSGYVRATFTYLSTLARYNFHEGNIATFSL